VWRSAIPPQVPACDYHLQSSVSSPGEQLDVQIYPNPTTGMLFFESAAAVERVYVYGLAGRLLLASTDEKQLDISALSSGCYMVKARLVDGQETWRKVMKW